MTEFEDYLDQTDEVGFVEEINRSLCYIRGLPGARPGEIVAFESGGEGEVLSLGNEASLLEVLTFSREIPAVGTRVARTDRILEVPVGEELLGHICSPLGGLLDDAKRWQKPKLNYAIHVDPSGISNRRKITQPLFTGVAMVDVVIPLGKGQRELVIGDRKTGKTSFLLQTMLTQARQGVVCVYAAIGKKLVEIKQIQDFLRTNKIDSRVAIVASSSQDPTGLIYLTPYTAMSLAEYFRDQGQDVLVILDDLTTHAKFYREIALLGKRFPGRESYPGDTFYIHAHLLERAGNFMVNGKEVSISCLPVAESQESDITGFVQTNLMSMTDGHIFFDYDLFTKGHRPAINPFLSVTRVGRQTQSQIGRDINRELTSLLSLYEKSQGFAHFGAGLSEGMKLTLSTGESIYNFFNQSSDEIVPVNVQLVLLAMLWGGTWHDTGASKMREQIVRVVTVYDSDKETKDYLDNLIAAADSFNELLAAARAQQHNLLAILEKGGNK